MILVNPERISGIASCITMITAWNFTIAWSVLSQEIFPDTFFGR
jgi:hypothetical protein